MKKEKDNKEEEQLKQYFHLFRVFPIKGKKKVKNKKYFSSSSSSHKRIIIFEPIFIEKKDAAKQN